MSDQKETQELQNNSSVDGERQERDDLQQDSQQEPEAAAGTEGAQTPDPDLKAKEEKPEVSVDGQALDEQSIKRVIEALIFASDKPLQAQQIKNILGNLDTRVIRRLVNELKQEYAQSEHSFGITEVAGGFQFSTGPAYGRWLKKLYNIKQRDYLTGPSLETLAIIAYRQPATRADIEFIRGVNVDGVVSSLLDKGLIKTAGKKEVVGRPFLYATTNLFLQYFGINALDELPALADFQEADLKFKKPQEVDIVQADEQPAAEPAKGDIEPEIDKEALTENEGERDEEASDIAQEDRSDR